MTLLRESVRGFEAGDRGRSVKDLHLANRSPGEVGAELLEKGFVRKKTKLLAERGRRGEQQWRLRTGDPTADPDAPTIVPVELYVHPDGGIVRLYPFGDPLVPVAEDPQTPWATVGILIEPAAFGVNPSTAERTVDGDLSPGNEACHVTEGGCPVPRSARLAHGLKYDREDTLESLVFAGEVMQSGRRLLRAESAN
jgi:hypothetical protein